MPICKECGKEIKIRRKYCDDCGDTIYKKWGQFLRGARSFLAKMKEENDASGNPKIYRAGEYSQEELRSLIPK